MIGTKKRVWLNNHQRNAEVITSHFLISEFELPEWADDRVSTMYDEFYKQQKVFSWMETSFGNLLEFGESLLPGGC